MAVVYLPPKRLQLRRLCQYRIQPPLIKAAQKRSQDGTGRHIAASNHFIKGEHPGVGAFQPELLKRKPTFQFTEDRDALCREVLLFGVRGKLERGRAIFAAEGFRAEEGA